MTDLPEDKPELETAKGFDSARLIADVRAGDPGRIREAYRLVFGSALGRVVLLHALASIGGVGKPRGPESEGEAGHNNGKAFAVLAISELAGFDHVAVAAAGMTQVIEGATYDRGYGNNYDGNPNVGFGYDDTNHDGHLDGGGLDFGASGD